MTTVNGTASTSVIRTFIELTKPRIIELLLVTTIPAMVVAADGWPGLDLMLIALVGGALSAGGANVINQVYDADIDRIMKRTALRPIPTDRVDPRHATTFGAVLGIAGFLVLALGANLYAGLLSAVAFIGYTVVYTVVLKRSTTQNIVLGGAAGAVPALIGWAAYAGELAPPAWIMFTIIFFWTPPHFWALSLKYESDYAAVGVPMLPVVAGEAPTLANIFWYSLIAAGTTLLIIPVAGLGWIFALAGSVLSVLFVWLAFRLRSDRSRAMRYFVFSNLFLAGVFLAMMVDRFAHTSSIGADTVWTIVASILVAIGIGGVVMTEAGPTMRAAGVSATRHTLEVAISMLVAVGTVAYTWQLVLG